MKQLLTAVLCGSLSLGTTAHTAEKSTNNSDMKTIRLIYPQWQGGEIARWIPEIADGATAARGYYLGAQLLDFLAPDNGQEKCTVPITTTPGERSVIDGVLDRDIIAEQSRAALALLNVKQPDRIVTLGGECSVSIIPFTYLFHKYKGDVAMIWLDAHPDITLPGDCYAGYHAMAVTACMGLGDENLISALPATIGAEKILLVGLRDWGRNEIKARQQQYRIAHLSPEEVAGNSDLLVRWLKNCGASKVVIHFDLDVLDPHEIVAAAGTSPDGLQIGTAVRIINDIAREKEIVGLTIAEPMPRTAIRIKQMLEQLPLLQ